MPTTRRRRFRFSLPILLLVGIGGCAFPRSDRVGSFNNITFEDVPVSEVPQAALDTCHHRAPGSEIDTVGRGSDAGVSVYRIKLRAGDVLFVLANGEFAGANY